MQKSHNTVTNHNYILCVVRIFMNQTLLNIKFQNDVCNTETAMNGTCYTAEECSDRDGVATGSCADGFGVCCVSKF